jgi:hypothetical protein
MDHVNVEAWQEPANDGEGSPWQFMGEAPFSVVEEQYSIFSTAVEEISPAQFVVTKCKKITSDLCER